MAEDREKFTFDARYKMGGVAVSSMDDVGGVQSATVCVYQEWPGRSCCGGADVGDGRVRLYGERDYVTCEECLKKGCNKPVGPCRCSRVRYCSHYVITYSEFLVCLA